MQRSGLWISIAVLLLVLLAAPGKLAAQTTDQSFGWYAELVSFDQAGQTVTARAPIAEHVARYVGGFAPGERIVLVWSQYDAEGDVIRYVERAEAMKASSGYIVPVEYVSSDADGRTLTFATPVSDGAAGTFVAASPGTPFRGGSRMVNPTPAAAVVSVALNRTPEPRPERVAVEEVMDWDGVDVVGAWALKTNLMGNDLGLDCDFTQEGPDLGGTCTGPPPLGQVALSGTVDGNDVMFKIEADVGVELVLLHQGTLNADATSIEGTLDLMGNVSPFTMLRE
jgi:hypothetical protein